MKHIISEVFSTSIKEVLSTLCDCDVSMDDTQNTKLFDTADDINILIEIDGQIKAQIIYSSSEEFSKEIASSIMNFNINSINDLTFSAVSEIGNIITGKALTKLYDLGYSCESGIPKVVVGKNKPLKLYDNQVQTITSFTSAGNMYTFISLR